MPASVASPHDEYDKWVKRQACRSEMLGRIGQILFYVFSTLITAAFALFLFANAVDLREPRIWGTFTQEDCEPKPRGGCRPIGTWVSDDGSIVKRDVYLDGGTGPTGTTPASYQPTGIINDETNNIVHVPLLAGAGVWLCVALLLGWVAYTLYKAYEWGHLVVTREKRAGGRRHQRRSRRDVGNESSGTET